MNIKDKTSRAGKAYKSVGILTKTKDGKDQWISGFHDASMSAWNKGMEVEVDIEAKHVEAKEVNGKQYPAQTFYNFTNPNKAPYSGGQSSGLETRLADLEQKVALLEAQIISGLSGIKGAIKPEGDAFDNAVFDENEEVPF